MLFTPAALNAADGLYRHLKTPLLSGPAAQRDPEVMATVSEMLSTIEAVGMDAVLRYAEQLDSWTKTDVELSTKDLASSGERLPSDLRAAIELGSSRTQTFARAQRDQLKDFEIELEPGSSQAADMSRSRASARTCRRDDSRSPPARS